MVSVTAQTKRRLAIVSDSQSLQNLISLTSTLINDGDYQLLEREKIELLFREHKLSASALVSPSKAIKLGHILSVDVMIRLEPIDKSHYRLLMLDLVYGIRLTDSVVKKTELENDSLSLASIIKSSLNTSQKLKQEKYISILPIHSVNLSLSETLKLSAADQILKRQVINDGSLILLEREYLSQVLKEKRISSQRQEKLLSSSIIVDSEMTYENKKYYLSMSLKKNNKIFAHNKKQFIDFNSDIIINEINKFCNAQIKSSLSSNADKKLEALLYLNLKNFYKSQINYKLALISMEASYALDPKQSNLELLIASIENYAQDLFKRDQQESINYFHYGLDLLNDYISKSTGAVETSNWGFYSLKSTLRASSPFAIDYFNGKGISGLSQCLQLNTPYVRKDRDLLRPIQNRYRDGLINKMAPKLLRSVKNIETMRSYTDFLYLSIKNLPIICSDKESYLYAMQKLLDPWIRKMNTLEIYPINRDKVYFLLIAVDHQLYHDASTYEHGQWRLRHKEFNKFDELYKVMNQSLDKLTKRYAYLLNLKSQSSFTHAEIKQMFDKFIKQIKDKDIPLDNKTKFVLDWIDVFVTHELKSDYRIDFYKFMLKEKLLSPLLLNAVLYELYYQNNSVHRLPLQLQNNLAKNELNRLRRKSFQYNEIIENCIRDVPNIVKKLKLDKSVFIGNNLLSNKTLEFTHDVLFNSNEYKTIDGIKLVQDKKSIFLFTIHTSQKYVDIFELKESLFIKQNRIDLKSWLEIRAQDMICLVSDRYFVLASKNSSGIEYIRRKTNEQLTIRKEILPRTSIITANLINNKIFLSCMNVRKDISSSAFLSYDLIKGDVHLIGSSQRKQNPSLFEKRGFSYLSERDVLTYSLNNELNILNRYSGCYFKVNSDERIPKLLKQDIMSESHFLWRSPIYGHAGLELYRQNKNYLLYKRYYNSMNKELLLKTKLRLQGPLFLMGNYLLLAKKNQLYNLLTHEISSLEFDKKINIQSSIYYLSRSLVLFSDARNVYRMKISRK